MVSITSFGVSPTLPTTSEGLQYQVLFGNDLVLGYRCHIDIYYIPTLVDTERFKEALAKTLHYYPEWAGRVRHESSGDWRIQLTNSPVPLEIATHESRDPLLDYDFAVFESLEDISGFILPIDHDHIVNADTPLLTVKVSLYPSTNESVIAIAASHITGDAFHLMELTSCLSALYQGLTYPFPTPILNPPTTCRVNKPLPSPEMTPQVQHKLTQLASLLTIPQYFQPDALLARYAQEKEETLHISLHVTKAQIERLKLHVMREAKAIQGDQGSRVELSRSDIIGGLVIATLNRFLPTPIEPVWCVVDIRSLVPPEAHTYNMVTLNPSRQIPVETTPTNAPISDVYRQIAHVALALRLALLDARAPDSVVPSILAFGQQHSAAAADRGEYYSVSKVKEEFATINSCAGLGFNENTNFGFPGRVKHWVPGSWKKYIRIFPSNPKFELVPGAQEGRPEVVDSRCGSLDVHFRIDKDMRDEVEAALKEVLDLEEDGTGDHGCKV